MTAAKTWLIVGLGNPGPKYAETRHNIGASAIDHMVNSLNEKLARHKRVHAEISQTRLVGNKVILAKSLSYMNESGGPVSGLLKYFDLTAAELIVLHDELDIPTASLRIKFGGGDNGHNGLKSIRSAIGTGDFYRIRMGIDRPTTGQDPADYVLRVFSASERKTHDQMFDRAQAAIEVLISQGLAAAQNEFHREGD